MAQVTAEPGFRASYCAGKQRKAMYHGVLVSWCGFGRTEQEARKDLDQLLQQRGFVPWRVYQGEDKGSPAAVVTGWLKSIMAREI